MVRTETVGGHVEVIVIYMSRAAQWMTVPLKWCALLPVLAWQDICSGHLVLPVAEWANHSIWVDGVCNKSKRIKLGWIKVGQQ